MNWMLAYDIYSSIKITLNVIRNRFHIPQKNFV